MQSVGRSQMLNVKRAVIYVLKSLALKKVQRSGPSWSHSVGLPLLDKTS